MREQMKKRVLIAMSGGIDSSVAAMLLMEQGYELVGVTFRTFDQITESCIAREKGCCSVDAIFEAKHLAEKLGFEHHILDVRDLFKRTVIQDFIDQYLQCRTPNPCVLCNPIIKWGRVL
ncbi:MAG: tRNA 2-thiouridine(34) synthase MnmA, partial [Bacteroidales bacterium]|nr:tRNA 2-thiouridine(34) synthase MnmA [Bacteroidales bacterium]